MGNGFIFPYLLLFRREDASGEARPGDGSPGPSDEPYESGRQIRRGRVSREGEWRYGKAKRVGTGAEKYSLRLGNSRPYRKPTQAGEMSILRRTRELALRNSAKYTRNFGRSVASAGSSRFRGGCRGEAQATVYQKHRSLRIGNEKYRD